MLCKTEQLISFSNPDKNVRTFYPVFPLFFKLRSFLKIVKSLLIDARDSVERDIKYARVWFTGVVMFATVWALAGILDGESRLKFDQFIRQLVSGKDTAHPFPSSMPAKFEVSFPQDGTVYDYHYETKGRGNWKHWNEMLRGFEAPSHNNIRRIMVPTVDTARYSYMMDLMIRHQLPMLLVGPTGTGKSSYIQEKIMHGLDSNKYIGNFITFSAQTSANQTQDLIIGKLDKKGRGTYGPPSGKKCIIFIDDLNMPVTESKEELKIFSILQFKND